ncbi:unnamed protein product [Adineta ricciae]|uniref:UMOD/GP2/OIT3-like D8C domain-containing protein n=1 Tax=Adineta ricciae TaxID=249248 RepID=A0A814V7W1_ADIRI|nr:unnamed protein product [Adineta ricciae]
MRMLYSLSVGLVKFWFIMMIVQNESAAILSSPQCNNYTLIDDPTRSVNATNTGNYTCDRDFFTSVPMWFRFVGAGGSQLTTDPVEIYHCTTHAPGWYSSEMPLSSDTTVNGTVCFTWSGSYCNWNNTISVTNCGSYYVYQLSQPPTCRLRYCTTIVPTDWLTSTAKITTKGKIPNAKTLPIL